MKVICDIRMSGTKVPRATSAIVVSNPVSKRFVTPTTASSKPEIKIVFTVTEEDPSRVIVRKEDSKPRSRARKSDLAKSVRVSDFNAASSSNRSPPQEPFIILGGDKDTEDIDSLLTESFNIPKFLGEGDVVFVQCPECKKKLKQKSYRSHLRTHLGFKQFCCELCGDRFTRKNDVKRHMKLIHEKPRNFQCSECEKYFLTEENLKTHQEKHSRQLICRKCQHVFGKKIYFENHIKFVHPDGGGEDGDKGLEEEDKSDPAILRKRRCSSEDISDRQSKLILLGGETEAEAEDSPCSVRNLSTSEISADKETKTARLGQLVQMPDGTFIIVDCDEECEGTDDQDQSQDAVQTLIDAVQELIQTHEATERSDGKVGLDS